MDCGLWTVDCENQMFVPNEKIVIGLVGQVCAGKSTVAAAFRRLGAMIYDADATVREIYTRPDVKEEVRALFGATVFTEDGSVDRQVLGKIVFSDKEKLNALTQKIIYPRSSVVVQKTLDEFKNSPSSVLLLDAPTLFEAGREKLCDNIVYVSAPKERREEWARKRGWPPGEIERREASLDCDDAKRKRADALIDNAGSIGDLERQVDRMMSLWVLE